jgi:glycosyltransferase involved in cell wall biosynthesis
MATDGGRVTTTQVEAALHGRLAAVAAELDAPVQEGETTVELLHRLAAAVRSRSSDDRAWLLFTAVAGAFPEPEDVVDLRRRLDLTSEPAVVVAVLGATMDAASKLSRPDRRLELVKSEVLVDVNFCAKHEHNTGIQRVVRETVPRWVEQGRAVRLVAWTSDGAAMRDLTEIERDRVLSWNDRRFAVADRFDDDEPGTLVVPWHTEVFLPEVPLSHLCAPLAGIAQHSGSPVSLIGYDAIPLVSAEGQRTEESERFAHYLTVVKHSRLVAGISESASEEFRGFVDTLNTQGIAGPLVHAVPLAVEVPPQARLAQPTAAPQNPLVLCVGSHEPRKNQEAVLAAAELLWRDGVDFELVFVGGGSRAAIVDFDRRVARLAADGRAISSRRGLSDTELWALYARARFTVFVSLHEGFGLPVAESLALGVPVLTSDYGALAEVSAGGGCVNIDPRDDDAIKEAMGRLVVDDELVARLRAEALALPSRSWSDYAAELWAATLSRQRVA